MSIKVEEYLRKLEECGFERKAFSDGSFMMYLQSFEKRHKFQGFSKNDVECIRVPDKQLTLYLKRFYSDNDSSKEFIANEVIFSRLYNALGVNAVKYYPLIVVLTDENYGKYVAVASQDLNTVYGLDISPFSLQPNVYRYIREYNCNIEKMLEHQDELLATSKDVERTRRLLANYIKTGLLDIICMMVDNHFGNKSVVRHNRVSTAEDVISFDLEDSYIDVFNNSDYDNFKYELSHSKDAFDGIIRIDGKHNTYIDCLNKMRQLRDEDKLPPECIKLFENIINLDFDKILSQTEESTGFIVPHYKKDFYRKLIDMGQEVLSK